MTRPTRTPLVCARSRRLRLLRQVAALSVMAIAGLGSSRAGESDGWQIAGRQGVIRMVIAPPAEIGNRAAFDKQIARLCAGQETCFVNFFGNSANAPVTVPLPDAIANEPVALLRRSAKQGVDSFRWACRLKRPDTDCF